MYLSCNYWIKHLPWVPMAPIYAKIGAIDIDGLGSTAFLIIQSEVPVISGTQSVCPLMARGRPVATFTNWLPDADHCHCCVVAHVLGLICSTPESGFGSTTLPACFVCLLPIMKIGPSPGLFR